MRADKKNMPSATATIERTHPVVPRDPAPELEFELVGGGRWRLSDQRPRTFTMVLFYRGLHCPKCQAQLRELDRRLDEFAERGIEVVAVSGDSAERAHRTRDDWELERLRVGFGIEERTMRRWGLFVSGAIKDGEPARFNEPGLFLIDPDGTTFYAALTSAPWGRPPFDDILGGIDYTVENDAPARGEG
jgi:peroxiredoxin